MQAQNIERIDSGPASLDATADDPRCAAEALALDELLAACRRCDGNAIIDFAPPVRDWQAMRGLSLASAPAIMRRPTLAEVLTDALDYSSGPDTSELVQLALNLAFGTLTHADQTRHARSLLTRAASAWARNNTEMQ